MMEKSESRKCHGNAVAITSLYDKIVANRAAGLGNIGNTAACGTLNIITEGEECVAAYACALAGAEILLLFLSGEGLGTGGEEVLPDSVGKQVFLCLIGQINVNGIVALGSSHCVEEGQAECLFVLTEMPQVCLVTCKACAMNS